MKTSASDKVTGVKDYGMSAFTAMSDLGTKQVARALETPVCRQSVQHLDMMLNAADHYVDTLLPETGNDVVQ